MQITLTDSYDKAKQKFRPVGLRNSRVLSKPHLLEELRGKSCHPITMVLLYLSSVLADDFVC